MTEGSMLTEQERKERGQALETALQEGAEQAKERARSGKEAQDAREAEEREERQKREAEIRERDRELSDADAYTDYQQLTWFNNPNARAAIEERCGEISFEELVLNDHLIQEVPIKPPELVAIFSTLTREESDEITKLSLSMSTRQVPDGSGGLKQRATLEMFREMAEYNVAAHLHSLNGFAMPPLTKTQQEFDADYLRDAMNHRLAYVRKRPDIIVDILATNVGWFLDRVARSSRELVENLGNG